MYQIFVVEDELLIRQSIRNVIENMHGPYALCGEASDGEMALAMMQDLMPDILLTDIRMPFLDGFDLIKACKEMMPWLKVVIISGFGDFESAQKAILLGVDQYLLKPVRQADLVRVIEEMAARIEQSKAVRESDLPAGMDEAEVMKALRQHFMRQLLYGEVDTGELLKRMLNLKLDLIRKHYLVALCSFDSPKIDHHRLENTVLNAVDETQPLMYYFNNADRMTFLVYDNDPDALNETAYRFIGILKHELQDVCPVITTVISNDVQRIGDISEAYRTAYGLMKTISVVAAGQVINVSDTAQVSANVIQRNSLFGEEFKNKMLQSSPNDADKLIDEVLNSTPRDRINSRVIRYNALISLVRIIVDITSKANPNMDKKDIAAQLSSQYALLASSENEESFVHTAKELVRQAMTENPEESGDIRNRHVINRAEQYVKENFCDPNISLISVANHVAMSSAYFSTVFSQTTGRSFITYLTTLRVEKAKELLTTTNMKLSDIALEIGYNEPNYFSHVFRKSVGMTPKEYRNRHS